MKKNKKIAYFQKNIYDVKGFVKWTISERKKK